MPDLKIPEGIRTPEQPIQPERPDVRLEQPRPAEAVVTKEQIQPAAPVAPAPAVLSKELEVQQVEMVLSEGLDSVYQQLTPEQQIEFKERGEEVAVKISKLLKEATVKVGEIISLIVSWLKTLPGINKFFAENQAKIKAGKLLKEKQP
ncbi:MAG: hypothetical protein V1707_03105 [bacterium]